MKLVMAFFFSLLSAAAELRAQEDLSLLPDTSQIQKWIDAGHQLLVENASDSAIVLAQKAYARAFQKHNTHGIAQSQLVLARAFRKKEMFPKALSYYLKALNEFGKIEDREQIAQINFEIGQMYYDWNVFENAIVHIGRANRANKELGRAVQHFNGMQLLAQAYLMLQQADSAIFYYNKLLVCSKMQQNRRLELKLLETIADVYKSTKNYEKAIEKQQEILSYNQLMRNTDSEFTTLNNIGFLHKRLNRNNKALEYFRKALALSSNTPGHKAAVLLNIGVIYQNKGDEDNAFKNIYEALRIRLEEENNNEVAKIYNLLAATYAQSEDFESAISYLEKAQTIGERTHNNELLLQSYEIGSRIYQAAGAYEEALQYFKKYVEAKDLLAKSDHAEKTDKLSKKFFIDKTEKELKLSLAQEEVRDLSMRQLLLEKEKSEKELAFAKQSEALLERQYKLEKSAAAQKLLLIRRTLEAEKKDREITDLQKDRQIKAYKLKQQEIQKNEREQKIKLLASNNKLLEQEKQLERLNTRRTKTQRSILIGVFLITVVILVMIVFTSVKRRQTNNLLRLQNTQIIAQSEEVTQQRNQLAEQNTMITDSMMYAGKIQHAVFSERHVEEVGLNYFVLHKPREIVSGDFHKIHVLGSKVVVAVVDCTGHGIPGAMMSMLGASFLNEIISEKGLDKASLILEELRTRVKSTLDQKAGTIGGASDGMDIALCIIDKQTKHLQYAGAYNPLYIIRDGQLNEIKADRQPIGIYPKEKPFTNHEFQLQTGDRLYAFSDGYVDQMNNRGMKFLPKRFQALLISVAQKPLAEQKKKLESAFEFWRGNERQTDDVLVMGIEI